MKKSSAIAATVLTVFSVMPVSPLSYRELLDAAIERDQELPLLRIAEERAEIAFRRGLAARDDAKFEASSGQSTVVAGSSAGPRVVSEPHIRVSAPRGPAVGVKTPMEFGTDGNAATPSVGASFPLIRGTDETIARAEELHSAWRSADRAFRTRALSVELDLARALKEIIAAESLLQSALRAEAKAATAIERARKLDGAAPGGSAMLALEREYRATRGQRRKAETARNRAIEEAELLCGVAPLSGVVALEPPPADLAARLPELDAVPEVSDARSAEVAAAIRYSESKRRTALAATFDAAAKTFGSGSGDPRPATVLGGLSVERGGLKIGASAGWEFGDSGGPRIDLRADWTPPPRGETARAARDAELDAETATSGTARAIEASRTKLRKLERAREDLIHGESALREDLRAAEEEYDVYASWHRRGIVGDADFAEVAATLEAARAELLSSAYDRVIWNLEVRILAGPASGEPRLKD